MNEAMSKAPPRAKADNQSRLLELAGVYRNMTRRELAQALGRDVSNISPPHGNPKLDYLVRLARVLDWPIGVVAETIAGDDERQTPCDVEGGTFEELDAAALEAHRAGDYDRMRRVAERMAAAAGTADERARAALREAGGCDGLGRYTAQLDVIRLGLSEPINDPDLRLLLQANLANAYYTLWLLLEARGMARELIDGIEPDPPVGRVPRAAHAFGHYVLGHACRRLAAEQPGGRRRFAAAAHTALTDAVRLYTELAEEFDHEPWRGIAHTCRGGLLEVEVDLGDRTPDDAIATLLAGVGSIDPSDAQLAGDRLESLGWWCVFGCNLAMRHLEGRDLQQMMERFTRPGVRIAERLGNWAMRERFFTLEYLQRQRLNDLAGFPVEWTIRTTEVRVLVGAMGRFPAFRKTGWRILDAATVVEGN